MLMMIGFVKFNYTITLSTFHDPLIFIFNINLSMRLCLFCIVSQDTIVFYQKDICQILIYLTPLFNLEDLFIFCNNIFTRQYNNQIL